MPQLNKFSARITQTQDQPASQAMYPLLVIVFFGTALALTFPGCVKRQFHGVRPYETLTKGGLFSQVDSCTPVLQWEKSNDSDISYDVAVFFVTTAFQPDDFQKFMEKVYPLSSLFIISEKIKGQESETLPMTSEGANAT